MKLSVYPTRIEIVDEEMKSIAATVTMVDGVCVKVELPSVIGWNDWLEINDAVRRAMHMMGMHEVQGEERTGYTRRPTLREISALEQPEQEPVAWMYQGIKNDGTPHGPHLIWKPEHMDAMSAEKGAKAAPLYAALRSKNHE